jgi:hypothetical protein
MTAISEEVRAAVEGTPACGDLDQAFALLTAGPGGPIDVCLLSRTEVRAAATTIRLVVAGSKARRNLLASGQATLMVITGNAAHYLSLDRQVTIEDDGAVATEFGVVRQLRDDLGVELHPILFRVEERLRTEERWERTSALLDRLEQAGQPS